MVANKDVLADANIPKLISLNQDHLPDLNRTCSKSRVAGQFLKSFLKTGNTQTSLHSPLTLDLTMTVKDTLISVKPGVHLFSSSDFHFSK